MEKVENEKFLNYELKLNFSASNIDDLKGEVKVSISELKKIKSSDGFNYSVMGGTLIGNPNYLVVGLKVEEDFALAFLGLKSNLLYFSSIVKPVFLFDSYGYIGDEQEIPNISLWSRIEDIKQTEKAENIKLFKEIGKRIDKETAGLVESVAYTVLYRESKLLADLYAHHRANVKQMMNNAILNFVMTHRYEETLKIVSSNPVNKAFKRLIKNLKYINDSAFDSYCDKVLDCLDNMKQDSMYEIFDLFQKYEDDTNVFAEFESDIFTNGINTLLGGSNCEADFD